MHTGVAEVDPELRERIELRGRSRVGAFLLGALQGRMVSGAEAEYAASLNAPAGEIPMDLWESDRPAEVRAATPAPATGTGVTVAPVQPFVFAPSIAQRLGISPSLKSARYSGRNFAPESTRTAPPSPATGRRDRPGKPARMACTAFPGRRDQRPVVGAVR